MSSCDSKFGLAPCWCSCSSFYCAAGLHCQLGSCHPRDARAAGLGFCSAHQCLGALYASSSTLRDQMHCFVNCIYMRSLEHNYIAAHHYSHSPADHESSPNWQQLHLLRQTCQSLYRQTGKIQITCSQATVAMTLRSYIS